jgi:hypothetical protein
MDADELACAKSGSHRIGRFQPLRGSPIPHLLPGECAVRLDNLALSISLWSVLAPWVVVRCSSTSSPAMLW